MKDASSSSSTSSAASVSTPTVSVLLPVYNSGRYLAEAIDSVLSQTFTDFELIAVDDGSKDKSLSILQQYAQRDPRVRVISRPNTGISGALNDAIKASRGQFLARMDGDDVCVPQRFEKQVRYLHEHPDCSIVGGWTQSCDPYLLPVRVVQTPATHSEIDEQLLNGMGMAMVHPTVMMRRSALDQVGLYDPAFNGAEDLELFLRLSEHGQCANLQEIVLQYRHHPQSENQKKAELQIKLIAQITAAARARRGLPPVAASDNQFEPRRSVYLQHVYWGWLALKQGNSTVARKHAVHSLRQKLTDKSGWRLLFCSLRGK